MLDGQIERRMRQSVLSVGSYWYTAWVNAGSPSLAFPDNEQLIVENDTLQVPLIVHPKGHVDQ
jgi:hypothetical protein